MQRLGNLQIMAFLLILFLLRAWRKKETALKVIPDKSPDIACDTQQHIAPFSNLPPPPSFLPPEANPYTHSEAQPALSASHFQMCHYNFLLTQSCSFSPRDICLPERERRRGGEDMISETFSLFLSRLALP